MHEMAEIKTFHFFMVFVCQANPDDNSDALSMMNRKYV